MTRHLLCCIVALAAIGCAGPEPTSAPPPAPAATAPAPAPEPAAPATPPATEASAPKKDDDHGNDGHEHTAPHGGSLVEFGEEFAHLELVLDATTGRLTAYALDGEAETPVRLSQPSIALVVTVPDVLAPINVTLNPAENALTGEKSGDTSQFVAVVPELKGRKTFNGTVTALTIRGQAFARVRFEFPATGH